MCDVAYTATETTSYYEVRKQPPPPEQPYLQQPLPPQEPYPQQSLPSQSIEYESLNVVVEFVEPILVEDVDEMYSLDLTEEQEDGEEYTPVFGFSKLAANFFSFQHFYSIPSASYFKDCLGITIADFIVDCCLLQDVGDDCLLEWLRLEKNLDNTGSRRRATVRPSVAWEATHYFIVLK